MYYYNTITLIIKFIFINSTLKFSDAENTMDHANMKDSDKVDLQRKDFRK